jgi:hypothetical protein
VHFILTALLLPCGLFLRVTAHPIALYLTSIFVLLVVLGDFFALVVPAFMSPSAAGTAAFVLMMDAACMMFLAAVLYAGQAKEEVREDIKRLKESKYNLAPA